MKIGDEVICDIEGTIDLGFVIGHPPYDTDGSVVVISSDEFIGMPVNVQWLTKSGENADKAASLRKKFDKRCPDWLAPAQSLRECPDCGIESKSGDLHELDCPALGGAFDIDPAQSGQDCSDTCTLQAGIDND